MISMWRTSLSFAQRNLANTPLVVHGSHLLSSAVPPKPPPPKPDTPEYWDRFSEVYDETIGGILPPAILPYVFETLPPNASRKTLDLGAGTGICTKTILSHPSYKDVKDPQLTSSDFSSGMLEKLRHYLDSNGHTSVKITVADAQNMRAAFPDNNFDRLYSNMCIMLIPDYVAALLEVERVLKPGGLAALSSWARMDDSSAFAFLQAQTNLLPDPNVPVFALQTAADFEQALAEAAVRYRQQEGQPQSRSPPQQARQGHHLELLQCRQHLVQTSLPLGTFLDHCASIFEKTVPDPALAGPLLEETERIARERIGEEKKVMAEAEGQQGSGSGAVTLDDCVSVHANVALLYKPPCE